MKVKSGFIKRTDARVNTIETIPVRMVELTAVFRIPVMSPAPNRWAVRMVKPVVMPNASPVIRNMIVPVLPTAARALVLTNWPTMIESTIL